MTASMNDIRPDRLRRELGVGGATMMGLGSMVGTGVFVSIGIAAGVAGPAVIFAIVLAAAVATCNALSSAQLAATDIGVVFQTQQGETRVMVNDGETAVIGGLTVTEVTNTQSGIPYLMNIPYLGRLFRTERKREQKRDLLIMVTPHIVDDATVAQL